MAKKVDIKKETPKKRQKLSWDLDNTNTVLDNMIEILNKDESIVFKAKLCHLLGFSLHTFNVNCLPKYTNNDEIQDKWKWINEILHIRLKEMLLNARNPVGLIWLDKTNFGTKEPVNENNEQITFNVKYEEIP